MCVYLQWNTIQLQKDEIWPFAAILVDLENIMLIEISQTKANTIDCLYVESKIIQMNIYTKQKQIYKHRKQTYGYQRWKGGVGYKLGVRD